MDRNTFVKAVYKLLYESSGFFDMRRIARLGRTEQQFTAAEANLAESQNQLPPWFVEAAGLASTLQRSKSSVTKLLLTGQVYDCRAPSQLNAGFLPETFRAAHVRSPDVSVTYGHDGTFSLQNFLKIGVLEDGYIAEVTDAAGMWAWEVLKHREPVHLGGSTLICVTEGSSVFTHWLLDTMPRFEIARMAGFSPDQFDNIVLAAAQSKFHEEGLSLLKVDKAKLRLREAIGPLVHCDTFCITSMPRRNFAADQWLYEFVNNIFNPVAPTMSGRRLFIGRGSSTRRPLHNEAELHGILARFGFELIEPHGLPVRETARLCSEATHFIAPHGAGLANLVFAQPGAAVVELYGAHISPEYWTMCNQRGHSYFCFQGNSKEGQPFRFDEVNQMGFFERNGLGYSIDPSEFSAALASVCG